MIDGMPSTRQLVEQLGSGLARLAFDAESADHSVTGIDIHDSAHPTAITPGTLVLGIGVGSARQLRTLIRAAERVGAVAVAVKAPLPAERDEPTAIAIVEVASDASWMFVAETLRQRLIDHSRAHWAPRGAPNDLFAIANTLGAMMAAPVIIGDDALTVLAWSADQDGADTPRVDAIVGRTVDPRTLRELRTRGVFEQLRTSATPLFVEAISPGERPRVVLTIRAGTEILGYVWVAVDRPLPPERSRSLELFAPLVALHLANHRPDTSVLAGRERRELVAELFAGGPTAVTAARRLGLDRGTLCLVAVGLGRDQAQDEAGRAAADALLIAGLQRLEDMLIHYLSAMHPSGVAVRGDRAVYLLLAWHLTPAEALAATRVLATDFTDRASTGSSYLLALAPTVTALSDLAQARVQADAVLRAMRHHHSVPAVAGLDDVVLTVLLQQLADLTTALGLPETTGALRTLVEGDSADGQLTRTLAAYLAAAGAADTAAEHLHIHVNTLRYRLRRIHELTGLDLRDADTLLLTHLQLRLQEFRNPGHV
ncbi:PucR family transcriptional regulator [Nocardia sp. NPDC049149]|uniref:PucR family transcriptional regulator n=1 Tax=Nocardia sp. NPDC049149 TaxID=3364315 RepID=UPI00371B59A9